MWRKFPLWLLYLTGKLRQVSAALVRKGDLFLVVKKDRPHHAWQFPQGGQDKGEGLLNAAQRELREECGDDLIVQWIPKIMGTYRYRFPIDFQRDGFVGAHVSFFEAEYVSGNVQINPDELCDFAWIRSDEFENYFAPEYLLHIRSMLS